jgi:dTMP kinase
MSFLVIEGLDGSGKSTQVEMLKNYLLDNQVDFGYIHFPRTDSPFFGELIARFLRGEFGKNGDLDPYLVALLYASDRNDAKMLLNKWMKGKKFILLDRYVYSNIAFQCAKVSNTREKEKLAAWIRDLEFNYFGLPEPALKIFLDVPFHFTKKNLVTERTGSEREYLKGNADIHEQNIGFQANVRENYLWQSKREDNFIVLNCGEKDNMLPPDEIHEQIVRIVTSNKLIVGKQ